MRVKRFHKNENLESFGGIVDETVGLIQGERKYLPPYDLVGEIEYTSPREYMSSIQKVCVMFSGGVDSLSLALRHLEKGESVALCHIAFNDTESIAAYFTYKILEKIYGKRVIGFFKLFDTIDISHGEDSNGYGQQQFAAFFASWIPRELKSNCKAIESAYVMNDDAISYLKELRAIYNNAVAFKLPEKKVPYNFPLIKVKHFENIEYVLNVENKYNVTFPTGSSEYPSLEAFEFTDNNSNKQRVYFYHCDTDSQKENKKNDTLGYIIMDSLYDGKKSDIEQIIFGF